MSDCVCCFCSLAFRSSDSSKRSNSTGNNRHTLHQATSQSHVQLKLNTKRMSCDASSTSIVHKRRLIQQNTANQHKKETRHTSQAMSPSHAHLKSQWRKSKTCDTQSIQKMMKTTHKLAKKETRHRLHQATSQSHCSIEVERDRSVKCTTSIVQKR